MKWSLAAALAACVLAVPMFALGDSIGSGSTTSGGIKGTIYLDYNSQYCSTDHYTKYQLVWNRADWDRLNTSWLVQNGSVQLRDAGLACGTPGNINQSQSWGLAPNPNWGNTGDPTHALGGTRYVSWSYQGDPMYPNNDAAWVGAHLTFNGSQGSYQAPGVCVAVNVQNWPC
jgi:hypothetical protein